MATKVENSFFALWFYINKSVKHHEKFGFGQYLWFYHSFIQNGAIYIQS